MTAELEPVAWTTQSQLDLVKELGNDVSGHMWGKRDVQEVRDFYGDTIDHIPDDIPLVTLSSAQEAIDKREERIRDLEAALDHDPDGSGLWRYWSSKSSEIAQKLVEEIDRAEAAEAAEARASALQALLDEVGEVIKPFLRQLDALHESWPDDWRLDVLASERWHLKVGDFRAARSLAAKIKEAKGPACGQTVDNP